jgi:hypothetical protein
MAGYGNGGLQQWMSSRSQSYFDVDGRAIASVAAVGAVTTVGSVASVATG